MGGQWVAAAAKFESAIARRRGRYHLPLPERLDPLWEAARRSLRPARVDLVVPGRPGV